MKIVTITRTLVVALVLVLTATGLWAAGAEEEPAAATATEKETVFDPATGMTWTGHSMAGHSRRPLRSFLRVLTTGGILAGRLTSSVALSSGSRLPTGDYPGIYGTVEYTPLSPRR